MLELINKFRSKAEACKRNARLCAESRLPITYGPNSQFSCDRDKWYTLVRQEGEYYTQADVYEKCANDLADLFAAGGT